ncbi:MAG: hypothetical protein QOE99_2042 [Actinomycetota bacterium]|nr:hypothetical protein [Actinomycetota bacterium]
MVDLREQAEGEVEAGADRTRVSETSHRRQITREATWLLATMLATSAVTVWNLRLWDASIHVPFYGAGGDLLASLAFIKGIVAHNTFWTNPDLGAPFGTQFYDYPVGAGDTFHLVLMRLLGLQISDPAAIMNVFYLLTYPLCAATAYGVLRLLSFRPSISACGALLFAVAPFHFWRGEGHLTLSAYYAVPLGCWLVIRVCRGQALFLRRASDDRRIRGWLSLQSLAVVGACVFVGLATLYYGLFTVLLLVFAAPVAWLAARRRSVMLQGFLCAAVILAVIALAEAPALVWQHAHGTNTLVGHREPQESEVFGLTLADLLLPRPGHRLGALSDIGGRFRAATPIPGEGSSPSLGFIVGLSWLAALGFFLIAGLRTQRSRGREQDLLRNVGFLGLVAFVMATVGGGSAIFAFLVSPQVRAWNRISIFITFFGIVALASLLTLARERLSGKRAPTWVFGSILVLIGALGVLDQTSSSDVPNYKASLAAWRNDARFVAAVERRLPRDAMVLELPYVPYPENPPVRQMLDYDLLKGYVHSNDLRWTYGAIKGRPQDWLSNEAGLPITELIPAAVAAGFRGLWVDQAGYGDGGTAVTDQIAEVVGIDNAMLSDDKRLVVFDLSPYARRLDRLTVAGNRRVAAQALVRPAVAQFGPGFYQEESDGTNAFHWARRRSTLTLANPLTTARRVTFRATLRGGVDGNNAATVVWPDGARQRLLLRGPVNLRRTLRLPTGSSTVRFEYNGPAATTPTDARDRRLQVVNLTVTDLALQRLERDAQR